MAKDDGAKAVEKRLREIADDDREATARLEKASERRLARLERDLAAARKAESKRRAKLEQATRRREGIMAQIADLLRSASGGAVESAKRVRRSASGALEAGAEAASEHMPSGEVVRRMAHEAADVVREAAESIGNTAARVVGRHRHDAAVTTEKPDSTEGATAPVAPATPAPRHRTVRQPATAPRARAGAATRAGSKTGARPATKVVPGDPSTTKPAAPATKRAGKATKAATPATKPAAPATNPAAPATRPAGAGTKAAATKPAAGATARRRRGPAKPAQGPGDPGAA